MQKIIFSLLLLAGTTSLAQINLIKDIHPSNKTYPNVPFNEIPRGYWGGFQVDNYLYFIGDDSIHSKEPWITDGTSDGTFMIGDLYPGQQNPYTTSVSSIYTRTENYLFQVAFDTTNQQSIWVYDIQDPGNPSVQGNLIPSGSGRWHIESELIAFKDHIYFAASSRGSSGNVELWRANEQEVERFEDLMPGSRSSNPRQFFIFKDYLYFIADNDTADYELWRTDGQMTELFANLNPDGRIFLSGVAELNGELILMIENGYPNDIDQFGYALWKSDGTPGGTEMIFDFPNEYEEPAIQSGQNFIEYNGSLFFWASDSIHGYELWRTDGTTAGTYMVKDMEPGIASSNNEGNRAQEGILHGTVLNGTLYFRRFGPSKIENWKTDGTAAGTLSANNDWIGSFLLNGYAGYPVEYQGKILGFSINGTFNSDEIIWSDGTPGSTQILQELMPGSIPSAPSELWVLGDKLFFSAQDPVYGFELRTVDLNTVSVEEEFVQGGVTVFPNPGEDRVYIQLDDFAQMGIENIHLLDLTGKVIAANSVVEGNNWELETGRLVSGMYLIRIQFSNGDFEIRKWLRR